MLRYERGLNHSYLIFEESEDNIDELSVNMLRENQIDGLLPVKISKRNGRIEAAYEISMFQNMLKAFEKKRIQNSQIICILEKLNSLLEDLEGYYLNAEGLMLNPEYIYWNEDFSDVYFCFDPEKNPESTSINELSELILKRADFGDYKSVVYAYELHQAICEENFSLQGILDKFEDFEKSSQYTMPELKPDIVAETELVTQEPDLQGAQSLKIESFDNNAESTEKVNIMKEMSDFLNEEDDWEKEISTGRLFGKPKKKKIRKSKIKKMPEESMGDFSEESFFMAGEKEEFSEMSVFDVNTFTLNSLNSITTDYRIENFPYLVGSVKYAVDACIESDAISRFHARFDQNRGKLYLSDLNSASGTYLNGERLKGDIQKEIKMGDKIRFGNLDFVVT